MGRDKYIPYFIAALIFLPVCAIPVKAQVEGQEYAQGHNIGEETPQAVPPAPSPIGADKSYTLGKEDVLQIQVQNQPYFSGQYAIGPDGKIQYSFVGDVEAAGLTKDQLKERLKKELERFVKAPEVSIAITAYRSKNIYILGEVARPGRYPMKGDTLSLRDAVVEAGLHTREAALRRVYIIRIEGEKVTPAKVDLFALLYRGNMKYNIDLSAGDIIVVPSTVPSEINRALTNLLSPVTQAAVVDAILDRYRNR